MSLVSGTRLGRYEIRSKIGEGGMGEVYRALDPKLNREVAIKVLPAAFAEHRDRLSRFEQEAQAAGALNHPNILAIYDVDVHDGSPLVVSELLAGDSLRERLRDKSLSSRFAIDVALQIARGLAAAHDKGIVHRDLKPENIFVTNDDRVKILDFGLAKLVGPVDNSQPQTDVPTRKQHTDPGTILGTVGYMSPEQARGDTVDHRSDIFSLGAVLYEMVTGERAFARPSAIETLNAIIKEEPTEFSNANVPPTLQSIVRHCLEKRRERRFQSANDVAFALETLSSASQSSLGVIESRPATTRFTREYIAWTLAGLFLLTTIAAFFYFRQSSTRSYATRFQVYPPENSGFNAWDIPFGPAISPDGTKIALGITGDARRLLWLRSLDSLTLQPLAGTEGAVNPFWSPDGRFLAFFAGGKLKKISLSGGTPEVVCDALPNANSGTWGSGDVILFTSGQTDRGILRVNAAGGEPAEVMRPDFANQEIYRFWPWFLPDGRHFLFLSGHVQRGESVAYVGTLDSNETKMLIKVSSRVVYSAPGYLLYVREGALQARPFDAASLTLSGEEATVADKVGIFSSTGSAHFSVSANGEVLAYLSGERTSKLVWLDRTGKEIGTVGQPANYFLPRLSPDGQKLAVDLIDPKDGANDIWIQDFERGTFTRFTFDPGLENGSLWLPDGRGIVYAHDRDGAPHLFLKLFESSASAEMLLPPARTGPQYPLDFTPDGRFLIYQQLGTSTRRDLLVLPMTGERKPYPFAQTEFNEDAARISPDGKWVAFVSDQTGRREIYVQGWQNGERIQISNNGGNTPKWSSSGKELFFVAENKVMSVAVKLGDRFEAGAPVELFKYDGTDYDAAHDGERFLVRTSAGVPPLPLMVATGWAANLKH